MEIQNLNTRVVTGKVALGHSHLFTKRMSRSESDGKSKYGAIIIIPKDDKETISKIETAINNAIAQANFSEKIKIKLPLKDGDQSYPGVALYKNSLFLYASNELMPRVVDSKLIDIKFSIDEFNNGTIARVSIEFTHYIVNGQAGISATLHNVQVFSKNKLEEMRPRVEDDFNIEDEDED